MVKLELGLKLLEVGLLSSCLGIGFTGLLHQVEGDPMNVVAVVTIDDPVCEDVFNLFGEVGLHD